MVLAEGVNIQFIRNWAAFYGGAIHVFLLSVAMDVDLQELPISRCFFVYEDPNVQPPKWKVQGYHILSPLVLVLLLQVSLSFVDNKAIRSGMDIYATEVTSCSYEIHSAGIEPEDDEDEGSIFNLPIFSFR